MILPIILSSGSILLGVRINALSYSHIYHN